jgi:hypothetical protein
VGHPPISQAPLDPHNVSTLARVHAGWGTASFDADPGREPWNLAVSAPETSLNIINIIRHEGEAKEGVRDGVDMRNYRGTRGFV